MEKRDQHWQTDSKPIVVLGAGISGMCAALMSGAPVYEAEETVGGVAASDSHDGFTFDRGIHVLQTNNAEILKLLNDSGVRLGRRDRQAFIYSHGTYTPYPFQVNTAGLPLALRMRCVWGYLKRPRTSRPRTYEDWIYANVGRGFADTFLIPYSEKFWTVHPRQMTYEWTGNRVPQPSTLQVLRGALWSKQTRIGTNAEFQYPDSEPGYGAISHALSRRIPEIHLGHRASRLDVHARKLHFDNGLSVSYKHLISTIPLPELVAICPDAPAEVTRAAAQLRTNSILVVNIGVGRADRSGWHWVHFPEKDVAFFRISFPHNLADNVTPPGMSAISAEVAYSPGAPVDHNGIAQKVVEDLVRVGVLRRDDAIVHRSTWDIRYAYCIHDFQRKESVRTVRNWMLERHVVPTGRYGLWNYFWSHEAMSSGIVAGKNAAKALNDGHNTDELSLAVN